MSNHILIRKPIGEILQETGLINNGQIQVALMEQNIYTHLKLGEILVLHGWLKQQTADFFGERIRQLINDRQKQLMGYYLSEAGLLKEEEIKAILDEQKKLGVKFGSLAVLKGCIKQETLSFFLTYFAPEAMKTTDIQYLDKTTMSSKRITMTQKQLPDNSQTNSGKATKNTRSEIIAQAKTTINSYEELEAIGLEEISWSD